MSNSQKKLLVQVRKGFLPEESKEKHTAVYDQFIDWKRENQAVPVTEKITSSLYLSLSPRYWPRLAPLGAVSDLLMLLNYVLDPVLYVLMRRSRPRCLRALSHALAHCFKRNHKTSTESMKTSCCPQETLLVSDSSGAEMRPLRALPAPAPAHLLD